VFESRYPVETARVRDVLSRHEVSVTVGRSFFPVVPPDLIRSVCGAMRLHVPTSLISISVVAGEGATCALYIYGGDQIQRWLQVR